MSNSKALKALDLLELPPPDKPPKDSYSMSVRLPGDTAERLFALYDLGPDDHTAHPGTGLPSKPYISRNSVVVALIEAGLEAVEAAAAARKKGKKNA